MRPVAAISVTVNFEPGSVGGRNEVWTLDGSGSRDPDGDALSYEWAIADAPALDPADAALAWLTVGSSAVLVSNPAIAPDSAFHFALNGIADFDGGPTAGTGATSRWIRLTVASDGASATAFVPLTIVNQRPVVDLGSDLRIAPGGRWWKPSATGPLDAEGWPVELIADVRDPDPGDAQFAFGASRPLRWEVRGLLASALDVDRDGFVDDDRFDADDPAHRVLSFDAPLAPSESTFHVFADDVGGLPDSTPEGSIRVDVRPSHWAFDRSAGALRRLDTGSFFVPAVVVEDQTPVASSGKNILLGAYATSGTSNSLVLTDATLTEVARIGRGPAGFGPGVADGGAGWWILEDGPIARRVIHIVADGAGGFVVEAAVRDADTDGLDDFAQGGFGSPSDVDSVAPASGGGVWVIGNSSDGDGTRVFRLAGDGALVSSAVCFPAEPTQRARALAPDGAGGVWVAGESLAHLDAAGAHIATDALPFIDGSRSRRAELDARTGTLWVATESGLSRRSADGELLTAPLPVASLAVQPDSSLLGTLGPVLLRIDPATLDITQTIAPGVSPGTVVTIEGGSVLMDAYDPGSGTLGLLWIEAGSPDVEAIAALSISPLLYESTPVAVDPARGDVWVWRSDKGVAERYSADGAFVQSVDPGLGDITQGGGIAIDPEARRVWIAWGYVGDDSLTQTYGRLGSFTIPRDAQEQVYVEMEPSSQAPLALTSVEGIAVTRDGRVCAASHPYFDETIWQQDLDGGFALDVATGAIVLEAKSDNPFTPGLSDFLVAADPVGNACVFLPVESFGAYRGGDHIAGATVTPIAPPTNQITRSTAIDRDGAVWYVEEVDDASTWLWRFVPGVDSAPVAIVPMLTASAPSQTAQSLSVDPFYGHLFAGFTDGSDGYVLRLDRGSAEVSRDTSIGFARLAAGY